MVLFRAGFLFSVSLFFLEREAAQGQNNVMSYTVPHLLEDFNLSHSELGGLFSVATMSAGLVQPSLGRAMDRFGARVAQQIGDCLVLLCSVACVCVCSACFVCETV